MRLGFGFIALTLCGAPAFAQEAGTGALPQPLQDLLRAAHERSQEDFIDAVRLIVRFGSETRALIGENARAEQRFTLDTALGELWSLALSCR